MHPEVIWFWYCWTELPNELNKYLMHCWCGSYFTKRAVFYSHITCTLGLHMLFQYFSHKTTNSVVKVVTCQACCVLLVMCRSALTKAYWFITSQAKCLHCFWWTLHVAAFILVFVDVVCTSACFFDLPNRCAPSLCSSQNALCSSLHQTVPGLKHSQHFIFWTGACIFSVGMALASFFHFNTISVRAILFQSFLTRKRHFEESQMVLCKLDTRRCLPRVVWVDNDSINVLTTKWVTTACQNSVVSIPCK